MLKLVFYEFMGSFIITFFGAMSRINNQDNFLAISLTYFFLVFALTYSAKKLSGGYFNPILTLSMLMSKKISNKRSSYYIVF